MIDELGIVKIVKEDENIGQDHMQAEFIWAVLDRSGSQVESAVLLTDCVPLAIYQESDAQLH